jgi:serine/threonine protein kinase
MDDADQLSIPGLKLTTDVREGGQAIVVRATTAEGRPVAVKVARYEKWARSNLERELEALLRIHASDPESPRWLVEVIDHGVLEDGRPYVVLPWFPHSLLTWLTVEEPGLAARFDALVQACAAVARLHGSGALHEVTVHRDLKPGNFLVQTDPEVDVCLADLGGVKARTFRERTSNTVMFTPTYAPLEQRLPLERPFDPSVDIHALGVMVFQVITGELPATALQRSAYRLPACAELQALEDSREALPPEKEARFRELSRQPLSHFYKLDEAPDLLPEDATMLGASLRRGLEAEAAAELEALLVPALERSLRADPDRRESSARELLAACLRGRELAGLAPKKALDRLVLPILAKPPRAAAPRDGTDAPPVRGRKRTLLAIVVASMVLGGAVTLGALWWWWPEADALSAEEAEAMGIDAAQLALPRVSLTYSGVPGAHIFMGGMRSKRARLRSQALREGQNRILVRAEDETVLVRIVLDVVAREGGWTVEVREPGAQRGQSWELAPDELLPLKVSKNGRLSRS